MEVDWKIQVMSFDTNYVNTGRLNGACVLLKNIIFSRAPAIGLMSPFHGTDLSYGFHFWAFKLPKHTSIQEF
jgi:hypothetical protein